MSQVPPKLLEIRKRTDLTLRSTKHLKETFTDFDGSERDLVIRYYQVQGILHLAAMKRFVLGDDTGTGKTLQCIAALCFLWEKNPDLKVLVMTTKSATPQWVKEFAKFTRGIRVLMCQGTAAKREKTITRWKEAKGPTVMVAGYRSVVRDFRQFQYEEGYVVVFDEATAFKNPKTQVHQVCQHLGNMASRTWGLTATLIKNHLMEGHGIYEVIQPGLFGSANAFMYYYCIVEQMTVGRGRRVPRIVGYHTDRIVEFREAIAPYYYGRAKHDVAKELPLLTIERYEVELTKDQESKYREALTGLLTIGETSELGPEEKDFTETKALTSIIYCQEIVNDLELIECEGASSKLDALVDLLTNGDLEDENVIVFTRFKKMVDLIMPALKKAKVKAVRVTGDESGDQRQKAQDAFQNPNDPTRVVCITMAGGDAINLQAAKALIFFDLPWSAGDFLQIIGRMIRIGSLHDRVLALLLQARGPTLGATVDHRVDETVCSKLDLIEAAIGERLKGGKGTTDGVITQGGEIGNIFEALKNDARGL